MFEEKIKLGFARSTLGLRKTKKNISQKVVDGDLPWYKVTKETNPKKQQTPRVLSFLQLKKGPVGPLSSSVGRVE